MNEPLLSLSWNAGHSKVWKNINSSNFSQLANFFSFQNHSLHSFRLRLFKLGLIKTVWVQKHLWNEINLMKETANLREKITSLRPKKNRDESASEASDFLCTRFQMSTKHFGTTNSHQKPIYVSPDGQKKETNSPSRKQRQIVLKIQSFFSPMLKFDDFLVWFTNYHVCRTEPFIKTRPRSSLSWNPDNSKVWKKFQF